MSQIIEEALLAERHHRRELNHWASSCLGKAQFAFEADADRAAASAQRKKRIEHYTYWCSYCYGYHMAKVAK